MRLPQFIDRALLLLAAHTTSGEDMTDTNTGVLGALEEVGAAIGNDAQQAVSAVKAEVTNVFSGIKADALSVIGKLGHAHTTLSGLDIEAEIAGEVAVVKTAIENALIAIAKHIGG